VNQLTVEWTVRASPLVPAAVVALGPVVGRLARSALRELDAGATSLVAATGSSCLLVLGDAHELPWADGAFYLGWDAGVLMPTLARPTLPVDLFAAAIKRSSGVRVGEHLACWSGGAMKIPPSSGELDRSRLEGLARSPS